MSIGTSGRIVIEVEPDMKKQLYAQLATDGLSLKEWFVRNAATYLEGGRQMPLAFAVVAIDEGTEQRSAKSKLLLRD